MLKNYLVFYLLTSEVALVVDFFKYHFTCLLFHFYFREGYIDLYKSLIYCYKNINLFSNYIPTNTKSVTILDSYFQPAFLLEIF